MLAEAELNEKETSKAWTCMPFTWMGRYHLTDWQADWPVAWLANSVTVWLAGWLTDWLTDWLAGWLTGWSANWLVSCLTEKWGCSDGWWRDLFEQVISGEGLYLSRCINQIMRQNYSNLELSGLTQIRLGWCSTRPDYRESWVWVLSPALLYAQLKVTLA